MVNRLYTYKIYLLVVIIYPLYITGFSYFPSPDDWRDHVSYMIMVDRFQDGNPANNSINGSYNPSSGTGIHGGDLVGITQKLDYLKSMGITAIWLSPVPKNAGSYHGYGAIDWYQVDPRLGTMSDLQNLVTEAHNRGIYIFLDVVTNHMGQRIRASTNQTAWNYPTGYTLVWNDINQKYSPAPFDNLNSFHNFGNISNYGDQTQVELGWLSGLNDIKTEDTTIRNTLIDIYKWWIEQTDCDGMRIDTVKHVDLAFWQSFIPAIRAHATSLGKTNFLIYGEVWDGDAKCGSYTGTKAGGPYTFPSVLYYPMYYTINDVFAYNQNTKKIDDTYGQLFNYDTTTWDYLATFIDNHDNARFLSPSHANNDTDKLKMALTFLLTSRGHPIIYYGTEQGFNGEGDPSNREDMFDGQYESGPSSGDNFNTSHSLYQYVSTLIDLRNNYSPLRRGIQISRWNNSSNAGIYAYSRIHNGNEIIILLNTSTSTQTTKNGSTGITTTFPKFSVLNNLLNESDTVEVGANGVGDNQISVVMPPKSIKILSAYTISTSPPEVINTEPINNQSNIPLNSKISITFNMPMNQLSAATSFGINPPTSGTFSWNGVKMIYTPLLPLNGNQNYMITITTTAYNSNTSSPMHMINPYNFSFTTRLDNDTNPPNITNFFPPHGFTISNTLKPTIQANITDTESGINTNTIIMTLDDITVNHSYNASSSQVYYTPAVSLTTGAHKVTLDVQDNCANNAIQTLSIFTILVGKIMDGNFVSGEWISSELRSTNTVNPWVSNDIKELYVSGDSQYLYVAVVGAVDIVGYNNVIGVYVDYPSITTGTNNSDYYQGINANSSWDPDFMYAVHQMENDSNTGGSLRKILSNGSTLEIGNISTEDCGALSPFFNDNAIGAIEFRIPWSLTNGSTINSTIKIGAWMGWANSGNNPSNGLGGGSSDELGPDLSGSSSILDNPWNGSVGNPVPVEISEFLSL